MRTHSAIAIGPNAAAPPNAASPNAAAAAAAVTAAARGRRSFPRARMRPAGVGCPGATRSHTSTFMRLRSDARHARGLDEVEDSATARLMGAALHQGDVEMASTSASTSASPAWVRTSESIREEMRQCREGLFKLRE